MKAQILKIAGVKSEKEFYKKYPSEAAFMKVHRKAFKKAQVGAFIGGDTNTNANMISFNDSLDAADKLITGSTEKERQEAANKEQELKASKEKSSGFKDLLGMISGGMGDDGSEPGDFLPEGMMGGGGEGAGGMMSMLGGAKYGTRIPRAQDGESIYDPSTQSGLSTYNPMADSSYSIGQNQQIVGESTAPQSGGGMGKGMFDGVIKAMPVVGSIFGGIQALGAEKEAAARAKQQRTVSDLQLTASTTRPEMKERKYVRPEDVVNTGDAFFPIYGVGTNTLARNGVRLQGGGMVGGNPTEIQNTYGNGNSIYDDLGYVPLIDENQQKSFRHGGYIPQAQNGFSNYTNTLGGGGGGFSGAGAAGGTPWGAIGGMGSGIANSAAGGGNAGGQIGGGIGEGLGAAFGPAGMAIGKTLGTAVGNTLDPYAKKIKKDTAATKRNIENIAYNQMAPGMLSAYSAHVRNGGDIPNYEDGGYMNPEYNPQVITMFGDHTAADFADYAHKDQYRAGGHLKSYTPPSERAMETFAMGGELETHWGGYAEPMSYNPYLPGSGETVVFRGQSHNDSDGKGNTGIGITYGENPVEVERGEPMFEMQSGGELNPMTGEPENTGVVFGNMEINKKIASQFNDDELTAIADKYHGKKFKNVGIDLAKQEVRQNKIIDKSTDELDNLQVNTSFDKLKLSALKANLEGANLKLKDIANTKISLANYQNAINDTKEEMSDYLGNNISAEHLAKGLIKIDKDPVTKDAKWGGDIAKKAKDGVTTTKETTAIPKKTKEQLKAEGYVLGSDGKYRLKKKGVKKPDTETKSAKAMDTIPIQKVDKTTGLGEITPEQFEAFKKKNDWYTDWANFDPKNQNDVDKYAKAFNAEAEKRGSKARIMSDEIDPKTKKPIPGGKTKYVGKQFISAELAGDKKVEEAPEEELIAEEAVPDAIPAAKSRFPWEIPVNMAIDYLRPTDQSGLDYNQLMGEMYAMSNNQVEPVQAQLYNPELGVPYDISYQDQLNANQADFNSMQRMIGYNPAAQSILSAQKYAANEKVLGEQFRANQAMKDKVYGDNRNILNQAKLTNLGILDKQYERQSAALSNTKATTQAALNSMSDKYAKNKLENRKLSIYENMYNYRFGKSGRAQNYNGLQLFDTQASAGKGGDDIPEGYKVTGYDANKNPRLARITEKDMKEDEAALEAVGGIKDKNGGKHKKNYKNSSVVKAYKNL